LELGGYFITFVSRDIINKTLINRYLNTNWFLIFIVSLSLFISDNFIYSQETGVQVEKSSDKVIIDGKAFFIHIVKQGHTLYSISKVYNVSQKTISRENPGALFGLRVGQALKIPVEPEAGEEEEPVVLENYIYHPIKENETIYSLSKRYGVEEDEILDHNHGLVIDDIDIGTIVKIPKQKFTPEKDSFGIERESFVYHRVEQGETLYSISREYDVSIRKIRKANVGMKGNPMFGEYLKIPVEGEDDPQLDLMNELEAIDPDEEDSADLIHEPEVSFYGKSVEVALLLPFYLSENDERVYIDSSEVDGEGNMVKKIIERGEDWIFPRSYNYIEFYEGVLMAVNSLQKQGLSIKLSVFDTERDSATVREIIDRGYLRDMDLIVGPAFTHNLKMVAEYGQDQRIPVVSPLASRSVLLNDNSYLFQVRPTFNTEIEKLVNFISGFHDKNIVMIHSGDSSDVPDIRLLKQKLFFKLSYYTFFNEVVFKEVVFDENITSNDSINSIEHALSGEVKNIVIIPSNSEPFVSRMVSNLNTLSNEYDILLVGYQSWQRFKNIELEHFYNLNLHICAPFFLDYNSGDVKDFIRSYRESFQNEPEPFSYSWQGHDIMYYFTTGVASYGKRFRNYCVRHQVKLLESEYRFRKVHNGGGFENKNMHLIRYESDYEITKVEGEEKPK
jgi:LysM repeat protein